MTSKDIEELRSYSTSLIKDSLKKYNCSISAELIENGIFNYISEFNILSYSILLVKVLENLKNDYVREQLSKNIWKPNDLCILEKDILLPEKWQHLQELRLPKNAKEKRKGMYKCRRCGSFYTNLNSYQSRSADEGMTNRVECEDCNFVFKF